MWSLLFSASYILLSLFSTVFSEQDTVGIFDFDQVVVTPHHHVNNSRWAREHGAELEIRTHKFPYGHNNNPITSTLYNTNARRRRGASGESKGRFRRNAGQYPSHQELKQLSQNITGILDGFSKKYDRRVRPNYGDEPVEVGVTMFVLMISSISEVLMDFTVDFYFRQMWKDPRLAFSGPETVKTLSVGSDFLKQIWVPDTFFVNEKTSYFHTATTSNEFLRISNEGDITRSLRLTVTATCAMDLKYFPMDSQLCNIEIESFGYTMADIRYKWAKGAGSVGVSDEVSLPQFKVLGFRQKAFEISLSTGNYSRLACEIQFVRSMGYYLIQIYIPSMLIVVISWVSFWVNRNAAPARVYLGITTVLTMTTLMSSVNKELPKISYVKSIDIFLGTCFLMVFAALLEYATVGYLAKHIQRRVMHFASLKKMADELTAKRREAEEEARRQEEIVNQSLELMYHRRQEEYRHQQQLRQHASDTDRSPNPIPTSGSFSHHPHQYSLRQGQPPHGNYYGGGSGTMTPNAATLGRKREDGSVMDTPAGRKKMGGRNSALEFGCVPKPEQTIRPVVPINPNQICGITPSDIDKYSRVVFPVCYICFNLIYWITYLHISNVNPGDLTLIGG